MSTEAMTKALEALTLLYANSNGNSDDEISARLCARSAITLLESALASPGPERGASQQVNDAVSTSDGAARSTVDTPVGAGTSASLANPPPALLNERERFIWTLGYREGVESAHPVVQWGPIFDALDSFPNDMRDDEYRHLRRLIVAEHERTLTAIEAQGKPK